MSPRVRNVVWKIKEDKGGKIKVSGTYFALPFTASNLVVSPFPGSCNCLIGLSPRALPWAVLFGPFWGRWTPSSL
jgi:hypothetical protein